MIKKKILHCEDGTVSCQVTVIRPPPSVSQWSFIYLLVYTIQTKICLSVWSIYTRSLCNFMLHVWNEYLIHVYSAVCPIITAVNMAKMKSCMHRQHKQLDYIINIFPVMAGCVNNLFVFSCYPTIALASILQSVLRPGYCRTKCVKTRLMLHGTKCSELCRVHVFTCARWE